jgi:hypothetical protein
MNIAKEAINDFNCITYPSGATFSPFDCMRLNERSRSFLKDKTSSVYGGKKLW